MREAGLGAWWPHQTREMRPRGWVGKWGYKWTDTPMAPKETLSAWGLFFPFPRGEVLSVSRVARASRSILVSQRCNHLKQVAILRREPPPFEDNTRKKQRPDRHAPMARRQFRATFGVRNRQPKATARNRVPSQTACKWIGQ